MTYDHGEPGAVLTLQLEEENAAYWMARKLSDYLVGTTALEGVQFSDDFKSASRRWFEERIMSDAKMRKSVVEQYRECLAEREGE